MSSVSGRGPEDLTSGSGLSGGCTGGAGDEEAGGVTRLPDCGVTLIAEKAARRRSRGILLMMVRENNAFSRL
jgi:hypothetical protein